ncbi:MAG: hypothetical protein AAF328_04830 [Planctomycetota bacterium]
MQNTRRLIHYARNRRRVGRMLRWLGVGWLWSAAALILVWVVAAAFAVPGLSGAWWVVMIALGVTGLVAVIAAWTRRESDAAIALHLDTTLELKNKLGSALFTQDQADHPFADAIIGDAERASSEPSVRNRYSERTTGMAKGIKLWRWTAVALVALCVVVVFLPGAFDPLGIQERRALAAEAEATQHQRTQEAQARVEAARDLLEPLAATDEAHNAPADAQTLMDELEAVMTRRDLQTPQGQREAQAELSELRQRVAEQAQHQRETQQALEQSLSGVGSQEVGPADRFAEALRRADFAEAAREFDQLTRRADEDRMSEAQQQRLAEQLEEMREQLELQARQQREAEQERSADPASAEPEKTQTADGDEANGADQQPGAAEQAEQLAEAIERVERAIEEDRSASSESAPAQQQLGEMDRRQREAQRLRDAEQQLGEAQQRLAKSNDATSGEASASEVSSQSANASQTAEAQEDDGQTQPQDTASSTSEESSQAAQSPSGDPSENATSSSDPNRQQTEQAGPSDPSARTANANESGDSSMPGESPSTEAGEQPGNSNGTQSGGQPNPTADAASPSAGETPGSTSSAESTPTNSGSNQPGNASASKGPNGGIGGLQGGAGDGGDLFGQERGDPNLGTEAVRDVQNGEGWVIASWDNNDGDQGQDGPATVRIRQALTEAQSAAEQAIREDRAPRRYHRAIGRYFDGLPTPASGSVNDASKPTPTPDP